MYLANFNVLEAIRQIFTGASHPGKVLFSNRTFASNKEAFTDEFHEAS
jgi:hypothetical protein